MIMLKLAFSPQLFMINRMPETPTTIRLARYIETNQIRTKARSVAALGALAGIGFLAETYGMPTNTPPTVEKVVNSFQHPLVGYLGALSGDIISKGKMDRQKRVALFLGATGANFATETAQSWILANHDLTKTWLGHGQYAETIKDYSFAVLIGLNLYVNQLANKVTRSVK